MSLIGFVLYDNVINLLVLNCDEILINYQYPTTIKAAWIYYIVIDDQIDIILSI